MRVALVVVLLLAAALILASFAVAQAPTANEMGRMMILEYHKIDYPEERWTRTPENFRRDLETPLCARLSPAEPERPAGRPHHGPGGNDSGRPDLRRLLARPVPLRRAQRHAGDRSQVRGGSPRGVHPGEAGLRPGRDLLRAARSQSAEPSVRPARVRRAKAPLAGRATATSSATTRSGTPTWASTTSGGPDPARRGPDVGAEDTCRAISSAPWPYRTASIRGRCSWAHVGQREGHELPATTGS